MTTNLSPDLDELARTAHDQANLETVVAMMPAAEVEGEPEQPPGEPGSEDQQEHPPYSTSSL